MNLRKIDLIKELYNKQDTLCLICGISLEREYKQLEHWNKTVIWNNKHPQNKIPIIPKRKNINIDIDHIHPKSKGGSNEIENLSVTHIHCNNKKGNQV